MKRVWKIRFGALAAVLVLAAPVAGSFEATAKRVTLKMKTDPKKNKVKEDKTVRIERHPGRVAESDSLFDRVVITGYDKTVNAGKESFFIINNTGRDLAGIELELLYLTLDGRQLHRRCKTLTRVIPAGETLKIDIDSWDTQHSFRYRESEAPKRRQAIVYDIRITPLAIFLYHE